MHCPHCKGEINVQTTLCPNCHKPVNSDQAATGKFTKHGPDPKSNTPDFYDPNKNVQLAEVLFDSSTGRFIVAAYENVDDGVRERLEHDKKHFPDLDAVPLTNPKKRSRNFHNKSLIDPESCRKDETPVDEISKSCTDLAIDG